MSYTPIQFYTDRGARVSSGFGMRKHPITGVWTMHNGVDFAGIGQGNPIHTPYAGKVTAVGSYGGRGNTVVVKSANTGLLLIFQHLHAFRVKRGDTVKRGAVVGTCGMTGLATGPHLHFEIRYDNGTALGSPVWGDPANYRDISAGSPGARTHIVQYGDALYKIAAKYNVTIESLVAWNRSTYPSLETDPGLIRPGWELYVAAPVVKTYTVESGDVMWRIARDHNVTTDELIAANPQIPNPNLIRAGDEIYIPAPAPVDEPTDSECRCDQLKDDILHLNKTISDLESNKNAMLKSLNVIKSEANKF